MTERRRLPSMQRRLLGALLAVSLSAVGVLTIGTVVPHLAGGAGHLEAVDTPWLLAATVLAVSTAVVASVVTARRMVAPMHTILASARGFAAGDHAIRLPDLGRAELVELVEALNTAAQEVEQSEKRRQRLTADIAHELRTPLTALRAGLEELRDGLIPPDQDVLDALPHAGGPPRPDRRRPRGSLDRRIRRAPAHLWPGGWWRGWRSTPMEVPCPRPVWRFGRTWPRVLSSAATPTGCTRSWTTSSPTLLRIAVRATPSRCGCSPNAGSACSKVADDGPGRRVGTRSGV